MKQFIVKNRLAALFLVALACISISCNNKEDHEDGDYVPGMVVVKFKEYAVDRFDLSVTNGSVFTAVNELDNALSGLPAHDMSRVFPAHPNEAYEQRAREQGLHLYYSIYFDEKTPVKKAIRTLIALDFVESAEPSYIVEIIH